MEIDEKFLDSWRETYARTIIRAHENVVSEMKKDVDYYRELGVPTNTKFGDFLEKGLSVIFRLEPDYWERFHKEEAGPSVIYSATEVIAKNNPEYAKKQRGLSKLFLGMDILRKTCQHITKKYSLTALRSFCEIYQQNPNISDVDAMVAFIKKEEVITNKSYLADLDTIPQELRDSLDLGLDEGLRAFVDQYSDQYSMDGSSLGGPKL